MTAQNRRSESGVHFIAYKQTRNGSLKSVINWDIHNSHDVGINEVKWVTVKFLGTKVPCTLGWPYTEGTWLYCDYFIWCVSCAVVVLACFVMSGCFGGNMCTFIYCVLCCSCCVFVLFRLCVFILICFICTSVRTTATAWKLFCSK